MHFAKRAFALHVLATLVAIPLQVGARSVTYYGSVARDSPEWFRPIEDGPLLWPDLLEYSVQPFYVDGDGIFDIFSSQTFDGYMHLYESSFEPTDQLTNLLAGGTDGGYRISELTFDLYEGVQYYVVTSRRSF